MMNLAPLVATLVFGSVTYRDVEPILAAHCTHCHGDQGRAKGLDLQNFPFTSVLREEATPAELVTLSLARMRAASYPMPPGGGMTDADVLAVEAWLDGGLIVSP